MIYTNKMGLPQEIANAMPTERHCKQGEISATTLIKGAKQVVLSDRHFDEIEVDISDCIKPLIGTAVHHYLEVKNPNAFTEEKFSVEVQGKKVTGQIDLYDMANGVIYDYKTTSVFKVIYKSYDEWQKQALIYAWLMKKNGLEVKKCVFVPMFTDWTKAESRRKADYPNGGAMTVEFEVTDEALKEIEEYINLKVAEISKAETLPDDEIPECSELERWATKGVFKVKKDGRKAALRVFDTEEEAVAFSQGVAGSYVEYVRGEDKKCTGYCNACQFCSYYKKMIEGNNGVAA